MRRILTILVGAVLLLASCGDELGANKYSSRPARFLCPAVPSVPPLHTALNNPGEWCRVTLASDGHRYQFQLPSSREPSYWNITADLSDRSHLWVAGLIVGLPTLPEPGALQSSVACYDLVCPTCYKVPLDVRLDISATGIASCRECGCRYDLNNQGVQVGGERQGERLFRYRVTYMREAGRLLVNN